MTTASRTRPSPLTRLASMELLGFIEAPFDSSAPQTVSPPKAVNRAPDGRQPTGRHSDPFGGTLVDLKPQEAPRPLTRRRNFRWSALILIAILLAAGAGFAFWLYQKPAQADADAAAAVAADATTLSRSLDDLTVIAAGLAINSVPSDYSAQLTEVDTLARTLFTTSADMGSDQADRRVLAGDSAGAALDVSRRLSNAIVFRATLESGLILPELETDPLLTDVVTATTQFGAWRAHLDEIAAALPTGVNTDLVTAFDGFRASLASAQNDYVDGIDGDGAIQALQKVEADLVALHTQIASTFSMMSAGLVDTIAGIQTDLARLLG